MVVSLAKGQKVDLTKGNPGLNEVCVGLGWDTKKYDGGSNFDLDASVFAIDTNGKVTQDKDFVFYGNKSNANNSIIHSGDNLTGAGDGDDEVVTVKLLDIPAAIEKIVFAVTIYQAESRGQNFGMVQNAFIRVVNAADKVELVHFDLDEDFSIETAVVVGELYRHNGEWKFAAVGAGYAGGLNALSTEYGVSV